MKKILLLALLFLTACTHQPKDYYEIFGEVENVKDSTIITLFRRMGNLGQGIASDTIIDGKFYFKIKPDSLVKDALHLSCFRSSEFPSMGAMLWASAGDVVKVTGKNTLIFTWNVKAPAPENKVWRTYLNDSRELWDDYQTNAIKQRSLRTLQRSVPNEDIQLLNQQFDSLDVENNQLQIQINENLIRRRKQMAIDEIWLQKLHDLALTSNYIPDSPLEQKEATIELYNLLTEEQKQHPLAKEAYTMLFPPQHVEVGREMADAELYDLQGGKHSLAELKGKYILLDFWSRGCGPCILSIPEMGELASSYKDKLNIVSISTDNKKMWEEASEAHPMSWNNWNDLNGTAGLYANYDQGAIPAYTLISPEGIVLEQWVGYGEGSLKFKLATLIK